jgi:hypothetical protein
MIIPLATRWKTWVCVRSLAAFAGSNHTGDMDVCLLGVIDVLCLVEVSATG